MQESTAGRVERGSDVAPSSEASAPAVKPARSPGPDAERVAPKPKIGDSRPAPPSQWSSRDGRATSPPVTGDGRTRDRSQSGGSGDSGGGVDAQARRRRSRGGRRRRRAGIPSGTEAGRPGEADGVGTAEEPAIEPGANGQSGPGMDAVGTGPGRRRVGRYLMCVHVEGEVTHIAVLEGRSLVEHLVSRAQRSASQIDGNIYLGRVETVLPGMEAAFIDIGSPKSAVLYWGDIRYDPADLLDGTSVSTGRIEDVLRAGQTVLCQVIKNPIGAKGARLTQEVSLPGRFLVAIPGSAKAFGISRRLDDKERRRLRRLIEPIKPDGMGLIVRTAAAGASGEELGRDLDELSERWNAIVAEKERLRAPAILYAEPGLALRVVREELNRDYRAVMVDDPSTFEQVRSYLARANPDLADRVELYDTSVETLSLFERYHVHQQLQKALDRKVWLPSGGSLIIERTEALTVIDVNTGRNVGKSSLEETVYRNNLEAADEVARQLRLRDIGGIIVIDFIDMEKKENRANVVKALKAALGRDKTRTQVFDVSPLGLVEMTRKRVSEGLVESLSQVCPSCAGRGIIVDELFA